MRGIDTAWRKSSRSNSVGSCVEVRVVDATIEVRDTKDRQTGPVLRFDRCEWEAFLAAVRDGRVTGG